MTIPLFKQRFARKPVLTFRIGPNDPVEIFEAQLGRVVIMKCTGQDAIDIGVPDGTEYTGVLDQDQNDRFRFRLWEPTPEELAVSKGMN